MAQPRLLKADALRLQKTTCIWLTPSQQHPDYNRSDNQPSQLVLKHISIFTTASMAKHFPKFPKFPLEVRKMIWEELIEEPRVLPIRRNGEHGREDGSQGWEFPFTRNPVLLHINQESRAVALRKYTLLFPKPCRIDKNLYINRACDTPFLLTTDRDSMDPSWWHEVDNFEDDDDSDYGSLATEKECNTWRVHWYVPGRMFCAVNTLCQYGKITRLAMDSSNLYPGIRDIVYLKPARSTPEEWFFIQDSTYYTRMEDIAPKVGQLSQFSCRKLKEIIYIENGDEMILPGKAIEGGACDVGRNMWLDSFLKQCLRKRVVDQEAEYAREDEENRLLEEKEAAAREAGGGSNGAGIPEEIENPQGLEMMGNTGVEKIDGVAGLEEGAEFEGSEGSGIMDLEEKKASMFTDCVDEGTVFPTLKFGVAVAHMQHVRVVAPSRGWASFGVAPQLNNHRAVTRERQ